MASRWLKLWTASAITIVLLHGSGCQARQPYTGHRFAALPTDDTFLPEPVLPPGDLQAARGKTPVIRCQTKPRHWAATPTARVFRGSASSLSGPDDLDTR